MNKINLSDFSGRDDRERFAAALAAAKKVPGTTVVVEPGEYLITTERSREIRECVLRGDFGSCPEPTMFSPDFEYDRGLDFSGHDGTTLEADGVRLMIDGFMEDVSLRDCRGVTIRGFEIDNTEKPYTKAVITSIDGSVAKCVLTRPLTEKTPVVRTCVYSHALGRFIPELCDFDSFEPQDGVECSIRLKGDTSAVAPGDEIYLCHTFHFRPSVLIENASDITIENVTVHSHAGMGLTAFHGENITLDGFRVAPSEGEHFSTNTDATHFTSCRGKLTVKNCEFEGQGDDGINVHTYYFTPVSHSGNEVTLKIMSPTWTHTQKMDYPFPGDRFELTDKMTLRVLDTYKVVSECHDEKERTCTVTLDRALPDGVEDYLLADPDATPYLYVYRSTFRNHFARGMTLKAERCRIEECEMKDIFELPIKLAAEAYWHEGVACAEAVIKNCRFTGCGRLKYCVTRFECGGIEVFSDSKEHAATNGSVTIEGNYIECSDCDHAIMLRDVREAHLSDNALICKKEPLAVDAAVQMK